MAGPRPGYAGAAETVGHANGAASARVRRPAAPAGAATKLSPSPGTGTRDRNPHRAPGRRRQGPRRARPPTASEPRAVAPPQSALAETLTHAPAPAWIRYCTSDDPCGRPGVSCGRLGNRWLGGDACCVLVRASWWLAEVRTVSESAVGASNGIDPSELVAKLTPRRYGGADGAGLRRRRSQGLRRRSLVLPRRRASQRLAGASPSDPLPTRPTRKLHRDPRASEALRPLGAPESLKRRDRRDLPNHTGMFTLLAGFDLREPARTDLRLTHPLPGSEQRVRQS